MEEPTLQDTMNKEKIKDRLAQIDKDLDYIVEAINLLVVKAEANNQMLNSIRDDLDEIITSKTWKKF